MVSMVRECSVFETGDFFPKVYLHVCVSVCVYLSICLCKTIFVYKHICTCTDKNYVYVWCLQVLAL